MTCHRGGVKWGRIHFNRPATHTIRLADLSEKFSAFTLSVSFEHDCERDVAVSTATNIVLDAQGKPGPTRELKIREKALKLAV